MTTKEKITLAFAATVLAMNRPKVILLVILLALPVLQCLDWIRRLGYAIESYRHHGSTA